MTPVPGAAGLVADEGLRRDTTADTLAKLKPSFRADGVIHAGNASQTSDGASAVLIATPERAAELGFTPIARYHTAGGVRHDLMTRLVHHMRAHDIRYGLPTMCEGGGTANATIVELLR